MKMKLETEVVQMFSIRFCVTLVFALMTGYFAGKNWKWYTEDLQDEAELPVWANPTVNMILWIVWFTVIGLAWHEHAERHHDTTRMDLLFPIVLLIAFLTLLLFFSMHDFAAAKWFGVLLVIIVAYMTYEGFVSHVLVGSSWVYVLGVTVYTVSQLWFIDKNKIEDADSACGDPMCSCGTSCGAPIVSGTCFV